MHRLTYYEFANLLHLPYICVKISADYCCENDARSYGFTELLAF